MLPVFIMMSQLEQRVNIKFKFKKPAEETLVGFYAVYGDKAPKDSQCTTSTIDILFTKNYA
jgi:hypothetical protein